MGSQGALRGCGFPPMYLKDGPKGQMLCLVLEILSEELNGLLVHTRRFSPSVADVILMRFSIEHNNFMMLLYTKHTNKNKPKLMLAFDQGAMTNLLRWILLGFPWCSSACCGRCVSPWCHTVPL